MVKVELIKRKLFQLEEYLKALGSLKDEAGLQQDLIKYAATERFLQMAIECCFDIGEHWVVDNELGLPASYRDVPEILLAKSVISPEMAEIWIKLAGFRNILVHNYADVDRAKVITLLKTGLKDFEKLKSVFTDLI